MAVIKTSLGSDMNLLSILPTKAFGHSTKPQTSSSNFSSSTMYKFNLLNLKENNWHGSRICLKKNLRSPQWIKNLKFKEYPFWRFDKIKNLQIIKDGGWHFSQLKSPEDIEIKLTHSEDHYEYKLARKNLPSIEDLIKRKVITYDHKAKSSDYKFSKEFKLKTLPIDEMPLFLRKNKDKYTQWFDLEK